MTPRHKLSQQPDPRYTTETIRMVVRHWAHLHRHDRNAVATIELYQPDLARALDGLLEEHRKR